MMFGAWWHKLQTGIRQRRFEKVLQRRKVQDPLWQRSVQELPFVSALSSEELNRLRQLVSLFLDSKEFFGAHGLVVTDHHAVMVGIQACLPLLHIAPADRPDLALAWYDAFVGIVLHPKTVRARREWEDENGVAHTGHELLSGEVLEGGPLMLAWADVAAAGELAEQAYNVVIHEFAHVMDVRDGLADGCPPMSRDKRHLWMQVLRSEYELFQAKADEWARFGAASGVSEPLLDAYAATGIEEFFAVAAEAYFVQPAQFKLHHPPLTPLFDDFFRGGQSDRFEHNRPSDVFPR
jgi:MtfA peptidase